MLPVGLSYNVLQLPQERHRIVLCTGRFQEGDGLRYKYLALHLQQEFPHEFIGWFAEEPARLPPDGDLRAEALRRAEARLFAVPVARLERKLPDVRPALITKENWSEPRAWQALLRSKPTILVTYEALGLPPGVLDAVPGLCMNLHPGWLPGPLEHPMESASETRSLRSLAATLHAISSARNPGPILRRGWFPVMASDDLATLVCRAGALGTIFVVKVLREARDEKQVRLYYPSGDLSESDVSYDQTISWLEQKMKTDRVFT